jgi:hypothetical protein
VLSELVSVESKEQEDVHLVSFLTVNELFVVGDGQFFEAEEGHVSKDLVEDSVVSVGGASV